MPFEFTPHKLVYGGDALGHYQGRTVLVPRALPGERLLVEEVRTAKGVTHARAPATNHRPLARACHSSVLLFRYLRRLPLSTPEL